MNYEKVSIMNQKALKTLEYDKIIEQLASYASSPLGRKKCLKLVPSSSLSQITRMQHETHDALTRLFKKGHISFGDAKDIRGALKRLEIGSSMNITELLQTAALLENTARVKAYGRRENADQTPDSLEDLFETLEPLTLLSTEIRRCILSEDEISDDASPNLRRIRRSIKSCEEKIHSQLISLVNGSYRTYLQDAVITMRDGRYCIPIKSEYKGQVPGMVHDQSSTGSTFFVEPMAVVKLNNDIRELEIEEAKEIEVILSTLSAQADLHRDEIRYDLENMVELDFIFARAALAMEQNANEPIFNTEGKIHLRKARHPLINAKKVVPIDLSLGEDFDLLIVTGPNTGGKTVSLKTVGLLTLMGQSGLHIPALDRSSLSVFDEVYADIGDEQSIEQSLSTFSSHMTNVVSFLEKADQDSLVLFDELGAGTDPIEGAALAISIIQSLKERNIRTAVTTHYSELKVYALSTEGVENASCEFDVESLAPTYKLSVGVPGKSNAFLISAKLGIPESVIDAARNHMSNDDKRLDSVLAQLDDLKLQLKAAENEAEKARYEAEHALESAEKKRDALIKQGEEELEATRRKAHELMQDVQNQAYALTDELRRIQKDEKTNAAARAVRAREIARKDTEQLLNRTEKKQPKRQFVPLKEVKPGQEVVIAELDQHAVVLSRPDKNGMVEVRAGILKTKVPLTGLCAPDKMDKRTQKQEPPRTRTRVELNHDRKSSMELNLLGYTVEEALAEVDRFLDHAMLSNQNTVYIIHGNGTGALRNAIQKHLRTHRGVKSFRLGRYGEGESGVTVVELK